MKRNWFVLSTIALIAVVGMFVLENTAAAHREARSKRQNRKADARTARAKAAIMTPLTALNNSWVDLTFGVGADQDTLAKALPIYQETRKAIQTQIKEMRNPKAAAEKDKDAEGTAKEETTKKEATKAQNRRAARKAFLEGMKETKTKFHASLKEILTEEQMTKLTELTKKRQERLAAKRKAETRRDNRDSRRERRGSRRG